MEAWKSTEANEQMAQAILDAQAPQDLVDWGIWLLKQVLTLNTIWVLLALAVGLLVAVGATEFSKRFERLFSGPNWMLRAQLYAAIWGAVVTVLLISVTTSYPATGKVIACLTIAPLAAFYAHRAYDVLRRLFPHLMARASAKLRGEQNCDVAPP